MDQLSRIGNDRILVKATDHEELLSKIPQVKKPTLHTCCNFLGSKQFRCFVDLQNLQAQLAMSHHVYYLLEICKNFPKTLIRSFHKGSLHTKANINQRIKTLRTTIVPSRPSAVRLGKPLGRPTTVTRPRPE